MRSCPVGWPGWMFFIVPTENMLQSLIKSVKETLSVEDEWVEGKSVQRILKATHVGEKKLSDLFAGLEPFLSSLEWVDALKALTTVHYMMREDSTGNILHYLARHLYILSPCFSLSAMPHGDIVQRYAKYQVQRILLCNSTGSGRMRGFEFYSEAITIDEGFLNEAELIQQVLSVAVECHMGICIIHKVLNTASRLLILDIQMLFQELSKRVVYMLENFFKLPMEIMERTARLYSEYTGQTRAVETCLNIRLRDENKAVIKLLPLKPLPALDHRSLKPDSYASSRGVNTTKPCHQTKQWNEAIERELFKAPVMDGSSEKHSLNSASDTGSGSDLGMELPLIDFY
ncbi:hypothetical protein V8C42DRAFT_337243 [Trichoderma barbatum]